MASIALFAAVAPIVQLPTQRPVAEARHHLNAPFTQVGEIEIALLSYNETEEHYEGRIAKVSLQQNINGDRKIVSCSPKVKQSARVAAFLAGHSIDSCTRQMQEMIQVD